MSGPGKEAMVEQTARSDDSRCADEEAGSVLRLPERETVRRDLRERHIQMISIAGMIGTGLFLGSGSAIARAGPVGALLGYVIMGFITAGIAYMSGELSAFQPVSGGFVRHATRMIDPAMGAATGWNFWYSMAITAPAEITAASALIQFWDTKTSPAVWISVFLVVIVVINFCGVRVYGESEVIFASLKILLIIGLIIAGLVVDLGGGPDHDRLGFRYWKNPGPFNAYLVEGNTGKFLGWWSTLITAAFSYANVQVVAIAGAETRDPRKNIPEAMKRTFLRVLVFYVLSIFIVGMIVPYNDPQLSVSSGTAAQSPFVIAFSRAGINVLPDIINAIVCTSAISSGSACVFIASRTLYGLSKEGQAHRIFQKTNRWGVPVFSLGLSCLFLPLAYLVLGTDASVVFGWFVNITTVAGLIGWAVICVTWLRFNRAFQVQGLSRQSLPYRSPLQPYTAWFCLVWVILIILFSGFAVFFPGNFSASSFLTAYVNIPIFIALFIFFRIYYRSRFLRAHEIDIKTELAYIAQEKEQQAELTEITPRSTWKRVLDRVL
ncbi:hypothetical protein A1O3_08410 [Capronia epimyces CBS 606.96]|uniref:Amino acid permease/ SLC12A domain-containing protein n=1 Tax=Capronia epimyces CBS 606.96 TaxID=1182542 RepID=W9XNM5_9EURO|nr:uncharacterized protein A1O3_08410 [Capronia epimyces CBS 606.96]EXJ78910.1 hypothetical protein A1O3_08410 [Capronia epimyces CBS 606.96]